MAELPRKEYPRPQFVRESWVNLNGEWTFAFDHGGSGLERKFNERRGFDRTILVPFAPESGLSGIGHKDFIEQCWYHRRISVPLAWKGQRIFLHFGGVDYHASVYIDGRPAGEHSGGSVPFSIDITLFISAGTDHDLVLQVRDFTRSRLQPLGKQSDDYRSHGCIYTRTTGIWRTVWMEAVPEHGLLECRIVPDLDNGGFAFIPRFAGNRQGLLFRVRVLAGGGEAGAATAAAAGDSPVSVKLRNPRAWSPADPFLYRIEFEVMENGRPIDKVISYAGLRKIHCEGNVYFLNNQPLYLRFVLDQGFYPDGIWTAPTDEALRRDIELSLNAGFNGARLHQKIFDARFHYWADQLGYLTFAEFPDWGMDVENPAAIRNLLCEWRGNVVHLRNHPSIIAWTPLNETVKGKVVPDEEHRRLQRELYALTHSLDGTRPLHTVSGYTHVGPTDLWSVHTYEQDPAKLRELLTPSEKGVHVKYPESEWPYAGQPYIVAEFGGITWIENESRRYAENSWGYTKKQPESKEAFYALLESQVSAIRGQKHITGFCYTQLTDVEQEQNGLYHYDRTDKFDIQRINSIFSKETEGPSRSPIKRSEPMAEKSRSFREAVKAAVIMLAAGFLFNSGIQAQAVITVDSTKTYQTITGWETVPQCWEEDKTNNRFDTTVEKNLDAVLNTLVNKLGVNRIKIGISSGMEDTVDRWPDFISGKISYSEWGSTRYNKVNDNSDPNVADPAGFQWSRFDWYVEKIVLPMKRLMEARGEKLFINLNYVDFNSSVQTFTHATNPAEYAELILVTFQHLKDKYNIVPDGFEVILEPDIITDWTPTAVGRCMVAAVDRLHANGFFPSEIIAPSTSNGSKCVTYYDQMVAAVPAAAQKITVLGYHRYWGPSYAALQGIGIRGKQKGLPTAMTEWLDATIRTLAQDLKLVNVSFWEQWGLCAKKNTGHDYLWADFANPASPVIKLTTYSNLLQQYFKYVRMNAVRIEAASTDSVQYDPVAFKNTDGKQVIVVNNSSRAPFVVKGLPAGTYGITYSSGRSAYTIVDNNVGLPDVTIGDGGTITAHGGDSGAVTIFGKTGNTSTVMQPVTKATPGLVVSPNPFSDRVTFIIRSDRIPDNIRLDLFDLSGRKVRSMTAVASRQLTLGKGSLESGAYLYKLQSDGALLNTGKLLLLQN